MKIYIDRVCINNLINKGEATISVDNEESIKLICNDGFKNQCWVCGSSKKITKHHALLKCWNPIKNITIPVCAECHKEIHTPKYNFNAPFMVTRNKNINNNLKKSNTLLLSEVNRLRKERDILTKSYNRIYRLYNLNVVRNKIRGEIDKIVSIR